MHTQPAKGHFTYESKFNVRYVYSSKKVGLQNSLLKRVSWAGWEGGSVILWGEIIDRRKEHFTDESKLDVRYCIHKKVGFQNS